MTILLYYPSNLKAVSLSSLMIAFQEQGHSVYLLTQSEKGDLHSEVEEYGVKTFSYHIKKRFAALFYLDHLRFLKKFIVAHKIDIVYSHLQQANIVAVWAQRSSNARFIICRHHSDSAYVELNANAKRADRMINTYGKEFIAPSKKVFDQMTAVEKVDPKKIHLIRYAYDFSKYPEPNSEKVNQLREKYKAKLILVCVARLIPEKRHQLLFESVLELVKEGADIKLLVLSEGYLRDELCSFVENNSLSKHIFFLGHQTNVIDHLAAADLVVHISASEASNNLIKEAGLVSKPVVCCHDVGDFDEYLIHDHNSILLDKTNTRVHLTNVLRKVYQNEYNLDKMGERLKDSVTALFSIGKVLPEYDQFHKKG